MPTQSHTASGAPLNQRIRDVKGGAEALEKILDEMAKMPPAERAQAWKRVHDSIALLKKQSSSAEKSASALRRKDLKKEDWAALRQSAGVEMTSVNLKLENSLKKFEILSGQATSEESMREDIKSKRSEFESKVKVQQQQRSSDYNTLITIVQTMKGDLGLKGLGM